MGKFELELKERRTTKSEQTDYVRIQEEYTYIGSNDWIYVNIDTLSGDHDIDIRIRNRSDGESLKFEVIDFLMNVWGKN